MESEEISHRINMIQFNIDGIHDDIQKQHEQYIDLLGKIGDIRETLNQYMLDNDEIRDVIGEKLFMMFYKVFPEAADADKALERIVKAQKKKPKE